MAVQSHGRRQASPSLDEFADYLSEGVEPSEASERMGISRNYGRSMLAKIRRRLGDQAQ